MYNVMMILNITLKDRYRDVHHAMTYDTDMI